MFLSSGKEKTGECGWVEGWRGGKRDPQAVSRTYIDERRKLPMLRNGKMMKMFRDFFLYFMTSRSQCPCTGSRSRDEWEKVSVRTEHKPPTSQKAAGTDRVASWQWFYPMNHGDLLRDRWGRAGWGAVTVTVTGSGWVTPPLERLLASVSEWGWLHGLRQWKLLLARSSQGRYILEYRLLQMVQLTQDSREDVKALGFPLGAHLCVIGASV